MARSILTVWEKQEVVITAEKNLRQAREENTALKGKIKEIEDPGFVEREARNKLFLGKNGEEVIVLASITPAASTEAQLTQTLPTQPWVSWWNVFF